MGLVVVGGCLTFIATPDEPAEAKRSPKTPSGALPTIVVDAGHGGKDEGTKWRGLSEKDLTLDLATRVEKLLREVGFPTLMTSKDNTFISLSERSRIANNLDDAVFLSIHFNSENSGTSTGVETFFARQKVVPAAKYSWVGLFSQDQPALPPDSSEQLAENVQTALTNRTAARNRGVHPCNFYVVQHTRHPAILIEGGFISNSFESGLLLTEVYRQSMAEAIVDGVIAYQKTRTVPGGTVPRDLAMKN